uniref:Uncharacterized protein n=1 Tax=Zea mays TaxID=4577 RepID=A0A804NQY4_MAIZE
MLHQSVSSYQASEDDLAVYYTIHCWLLPRQSILSGVTGEGLGVMVQPSAVSSGSTPDVADAQAPPADKDDDDDVNSAYHSDKKTMCSTEKLPVLINWNQHHRCQHLWLICVIAPVDGAASCCSFGQTSTFWNC